MIARSLKLVFFVALTVPGQMWGATPEWLRQLTHVTVPSYPSDTNAVVLLDEQVTTVRDNGDITTVYRHAIKVLRPQGRGLATATIAFDNETRLTWLKGWSIDTKGKETELKESDAIETALFSESLYDDSRHKILKLPAEVGYIVGYEYEQKRRPMVYQDVWDIQDSSPVLKTRFTLQLPARWEFDAVWMNHAELKPQTAGTQWTWELDNVTPFEKEPEMPARRAVTARMVVNLFPPRPELQGKAHASWRDVGKWYANLTAGRRDASADIRTQAMQLTASQATPLAKLQALAAFVQRDVRYVAIEIGIGGYQPHPAAEILKNHYGDCKDKATLLSSLLSVTGIESYYVLVHTDRGVVRKDVPSAVTFNHAIVAIKLPAGKYDTPMSAAVDHPHLGTIVFFDPTDTLTPFGQMPSYLQGSLGLVVGPDGGELVDLPLPKPEWNRLLRNAKITLDPDGSITGDVEEVRTGALARSTRARFLHSEGKDRAKIVESFLGSFLNDFTLLSGTLGNLDEYDKALVIRYRFKAQNYAKHAGNLLLLRPRVLGDKTVDLESEKARRFPVEFESPVDEADTFEIALPAGFVVDELPQAANVKFAYGQYSSSTAAGKGSVIYKRNYLVNNVMVQPAEIDQLKRFYRQIANDERNSAVLKQAAQ